MSNKVTYRKGDYIEAEGQFIDPVAGKISQIGYGGFTPWFEVRTKDKDRRFRIVDLDVMGITKHIPVTHNQRYRTRNTK